MRVVSYYFRRVRHVEELDHWAAMSRDIPERDWKVFRELHKVALGRLCEKILAEAKAEIERADKSPHERYLALYRLLQERDDDVARGFNDLRRSTAMMYIGIIYRMGFITESEVQRFSPQIQQIVCGRRQDNGSQADRFDG